MGASPRRVCQRVLSFVAGVGLSSVPLRVSVVLASKGGRQTRPLAWKGQGMMMPHCVPPPPWRASQSLRAEGPGPGVLQILLWYDPHGSDAAEYLYPLNPASLHFPSRPVTAMAQLVVQGCGLFSITLSLAFVRLLSIGTVRSLFFPPTLP